MDFSKIMFLESKSVHYVKYIYLIRITIVPRVVFSISFVIILPE